MLSYDLHLFCVEFVTSISVGVGLVSIPILDCKLKRAGITCIFIYVVYQVSSMYKTLKECFSNENTASYFLL